jgi:hypothetical protein
LAEVVQDRGDLLVLVNATRALHDLLEGGIPALIEMCEVITARDNLARGLRVNFREDAFLNDGRIQFGFEN